jgi:Flp pilus assembly protein CpaB
MINKLVPASLHKLVIAIAPVIVRIREMSAANYLALCRNNRRRQQVIAGLVCCAGLTFFMTLSRMQSATTSLGLTTPVLIATRSIEQGDIITAQLFSLRTLPRAAVAPTALHDLQFGLVAQQSISIGELLTTTNTGTSTSNQLQLPVGFRSVAIVPPAALPPMQVGDHVDIIANGIVLAADALVLSLIENTTGEVTGVIVTGVIVAVPAELSAAVASAAAIGDATLVVSS